MATKTDKKTLELIAEIKKRKAEIAKIDRPNWKTNCAFPYVEGSSSTQNIQVLSSTQELIKIAAFLIEKKARFEEAAKLLGIESPPSFEWNGFSCEDWTEDLKARINKIQISSKRKNLEALESRLNSVISPELKAQMELDAISEALA